jgi:adenine-specific DNA-methyltransferase
MQNKQKLELTWIGKENRPRLEPRILLEDPEKSYHAQHRISKKDIFDNRLIFGDNLLALKALEHEFTGKIKCIYIDPPFNTGNAFEHYDDSIEHSIWLSLMRDRLALLKCLLSKDGLIFVHIDNNEFAYLKVLMDELFERNNFIQMISVKRASPAGFKVINPGPLTVTDYILLYAKNKESMDYKPIRIPVDYDENYNLYIDNIHDSPNNWKISKLTDFLYSKYNLSNWREAKEKWGSQWKAVRNSLLGDLAVELKDQVVSVRDPHKPSVRIKEAMSKSKVNREQVLTLERDNNEPIYIYNGGSLAFYKDKLREIDGILTPTELLTDFWDDINFAGIADEGGVQFKNSKKPEMLIKRILELSTNPGDLVLDSFAGSGTTGAVAHKMGRRWIMVELGEHCHTHIIPRLQKVINGEDPGGITKAVDWKGGGGFRYYRLAPSLLEKDKWGNWIINREYNAAMLAEALCKIEGFSYAPSDSVYWMHGKSTENDYIYVTTQNLGRDQLAHLSDEVGSGRTLLVMCTAFRARADEFPNLTIKKIPNAVLARCEWGKDDYSLRVENLPSAPKPAKEQGLLFEEEEQ